MYENCAVGANKKKNLPAPEKRIPLAIHCREKRSSALPAPKSSRRCWNSRLMVGLWLVLMYEEKNKSEILDNCN
ncbi:hypothetical protein Q3G72_032312 [Acer saccharum]|nr:hypothetical protein Q3G72_032312 [Acer saccharum]